MLHERPDPMRSPASGAFSSPPKSITGSLCSLGLGAPRYPSKSASAQAGAPFAANFVHCGDRTVLNVPQGTPPAGDPLCSRYPSKSASAWVQGLMRGCLIGPWWRRTAVLLPTYFSLKRPVSLFCATALISTMTAAIKNNIKGR